MKRYILLILILTISALSSVQNQTIEKKVNSLEKPLYTPFVENYILNELKQLRDENRDLKVELHETLAKKEVEISNNAISYATSTINNMFYILAAATSLLVIIGWTSIRDMNDKIRNIVNEKVSVIIDEYESRMLLVEKDLEKRSKQVFQNQRDIEETNTIHSLWMRSSQEKTLNGQINIYNEILSIRPDDVEAIISKADAALNLNETHWALSLTNHALEIDDQYGDGFYQRAKVYSVLGFLDNAIEDLTKAVELNEQYIHEIEKEEVFQVLLDNEKVQTLISRYKA